MALIHLKVNGHGRREPRRAPGLTSEISE